MNHFFAYINRMRFIQRWALMRNSYSENIQEHSHQVAEPFACRHAKTGRWFPPGFLHSWCQLMLTVLACSGRKSLSMS